jgi:Cu2+-exporting ATPase
MRLVASAVDVEREATGRISPGTVPGPAPAPTRCTHCALPIPAERRSSPFCCAGCEAVYGLLRAAGLERFHELAGPALQPVGPVPRPAVLDWLPELETRAATAGGPVVLTLDVQGIRCAACVWLLQQLWRRLPGALSLRLDASLGRATLAYDPRLGTAAAFLRRAAAFGYPMAPASRAARRDTGLLVRLGICAALAMNAMILAFARYFGLAAAGGELAALFEAVSLGLATLSVLIGGPVFFRAAIAGLRARMSHMDLPIALGLLLAYGGSVHGFLTGGATYFDTVSIFVALMVTGRFVQERALARSRDLVLADDGAEHLRARRLSADGVASVPVAELAAGDELLLAPGDLVPVRVRLREAARCSLDWIDGESEPRAFTAGDEVPAGAFVAGRSPVRAAVVADYRGSGLAELLGRPPVDREDTHGRVRFWSALARSYAVAVLLLAAVAATIWAAVEPARALPVAIAVLTITCPCAFGIATPLAFHLAFAALRRQGVFVRTKTLFDKLARVRKVLFDKTGTLTFGGLRAVALRPPPAELIPVLATLAGSSNHPASQAVAATLPPAAGFVPELRVVEQPGGGLSGVVGDREFRLGQPAFAGVATAGGVARECVFAAGGRLLAWFQLDEDYRDGAGAEIAALAARGLEVHLLSGDRPDRVAAAAAQLGIEPGRARGGLSPDAKAALVTALDDHDTLMIGDGLNDAPAFAAAWCAGTPAMDRPVLPARADFFFRGAQAGSVLAVLDVAGALRATVRANLRLAVLYNAGALVPCFLGLMTPLMCAVLMPLSSLALVAHTVWRLGGRRCRR